MRSHECFAWLIYFTLSLSLFFLFCFVYVVNQLRPFFFFFYTKQIPTARAIHLGSVAGEEHPVAQRSRRQIKRHEELADSSAGRDDR